MEYFSEPNRIIEQELTRFPQTRLQDIYKVFYQGTFGPAHFVRSRQNAETAIKKELDSILEVKQTNIFHNISYIGWFYRVDLSYLKLTTMDITEFSDLFYRSSLLDPPISYSNWKQEWKKIVGKIENDFAIVNIKKDREWLQRKLEKGEYICSHSDIFHKEYHPHYRLIYGGFVKELQTKIKKASVR
ncbi:MAG: hypothetical protein PWQ09_1811 [Candidatus Cloacimonadota bacterium]|nr:hypothetical protein [Candidatus Cloacimonadota bacterium]